MTENESKQFCPSDDISFEDTPKGPGVSPPKPNELWRCYMCGGSIRNNEDIKQGEICKCGSRKVIPATPKWWEIIMLFFRTWWRYGEPTLYLTERNNG